MIRNYHVSNFKSISDSSLTLSSANVLLGLNSSGKSSLLQPLLLLRQSALVGSLKDNKALLNGPLVSLGTGRDVLSEFAAEEVTRIHWDETKVRLPYAPTENELDVITEDEVAIDFALPPLDDVIYLSTSRIPPQVLYARHHNYERASPIVGVQGEDAPGYLAAFGNAPLLGGGATRDAEISGTLMERVSYWVRRISPGVSISLDDFLQLDGLTLGFQFDGQGGVRTRPYRAANVGFGLSHSLGIVLALVAAKPGSLILLEGPEAHLHPRAQRHMGHLIGQAAADGVQVIVETHSQDLVRGLCASVASGILKRNELTVNYCVRDSAVTQVAQIQVNHSGRLAQIGGYDGVPKEYYSEFGLQ